jgi:hypothetical protein
MKIPFSNISPFFNGTTEQESKAIRRILDLEGTPGAIQEFDRSQGELGDYWYWFCLSTLWVSYTGFSELDMWKRLFSAERPNRAQCLMKPTEYRALMTGPDEITVYRAHRPNETDWIAYTLNAQIAATRFAVQRGVDEIKAYGVRKEDVLALFLRRGEDEVLVLDKSRAQFVTTIKVVCQEEMAHGLC